MSPAIMVPTEKLDAPANVDTPFPAGAWLGTLEEVRVRGFPDWVTPHQGYASEDGEILSIQLGSNEPLEGQAEIGARKHFVDFVTRDGDLTPDGVDITEMGSPSWQLQRSTRLLMILAQALGATEEVDYEGTSMTVASETFLDDLRDGAFNGSKVNFITYHRNYKAKDGTPGTEVVTKEFLQVV